LSKSELRGVLKKFMITESPELLSRVAVDGEEEVFDAVALKELLTRAANGQVTDGLGRRLRPIVLAGISKLSSDSHRGSENEKTPPPPQRSPRKRVIPKRVQLEKVPEVQPEVVGAVAPQLATASDDSSPAAQTPTLADPPLPPRRKPVPGESYLPAFYDSLEFYN
jgi:hypothetical protein